MSNSDKPRFSFTYSRSVSSYLANLFLTSLTAVYAILLLHENDKQWSFYATIFASICLFSLMIGGLKWGRVLLTGARVFHHIQTPIRLWQAWQRAILTRASLLLTIVFFAISVLELSHRSLFPTTALLAMASLSLAAGFSLSLAFNNYLNCRSYLLLFAVASYVMYIILGPGIKQWIDASWEWHFPAILTWPILVHGALLYWEKPPENKGKSLFLQLKELGFISKLRHFYYRFTDLGSLRMRQKKDPLTTSDKIFRSAGLIWFLLLSSNFLLEWRASVNLVHLTLLVAFAAFSSSYIVVKDLHWRFILLPNNFQQGRIANHLLLSSVTYYGYWALILFILLYGSTILFDMPKILQRTTYASMFSIATLVVELVCAFCIGLVIRGSKKPERSLFYLFMTCLVMAAAVTSYFYLQQMNPLKTAIFTMNENYVVGVLIIGVCALIYANRLWTRERLLAYL
ncbi:hypothetical protein [Undibacterium sp. Ji22W]|uniref:hypothetical protein n=1 Tax=Undibacterium sp. Ji22W TaxID=3413038 RepID=UPI003BF14309